MAVLSGFTLLIRKIRKTIQQWYRMAIPAAAAIPINSQRRQRGLGLLLTSVLGRSRTICTIGRHYNACKGELRIVTCVNNQGSRLPALQTFNPFGVAWMAKTPRRSLVFWFHFEPDEKTRNSHKHPVVDSRPRRALLRDCNRPVSRRR